VEQADYTSQKETFIVKRRAERQTEGDSSRKLPTQHRRQANADSFVNLDDLIDCTIFHQGNHYIVGDKAFDQYESHKEDTLLAYMAARGTSDTHPGNICLVSTSRHAPSHKKTILNVNEV
jgi:hypothetical protein